MNLEGSRVLVSGASRGIGAALVEEAQLTAAPRRTTEWLLTGVAHQEAG